MYLCICIYGVAAISRHARSEGFSAPDSLEKKAPFPWVLSRIFREKKPYSKDSRFLLKKDLNLARILAK